MSYQGNVDGTRHAAEQEVTFTVDAPPEVAPGVYIGTLNRLRAFSVDTEDGKRSLIAWSFAIADADGETVRDENGEALVLDGVTSTATGGASKAFGWLVALLGPAAVEPHARIRASELTGRKAQVTVGPDKKGWPKVQSLTAMLRSKPKATAPEPVPSRADQYAPGPDMQSLADDDLPF